MFTKGVNAFLPFSQKTNRCIMKHTSVIAAVLLCATALVSFAAETNEVYRIDFEQSEGYQLGDIFTQDKGFRPYSAANTNCLGQVIDTNTFWSITSGTQALLVGVQDTAYGNGNFCCDFDISNIDIDKNYVQFEIQIKIAIIDRTDLCGNTISCCRGFTSAEACHAVYHSILTL